MADLMTHQQRAAMDVGSSVTLQSSADQRMFLHMTSSGRVEASCLDSAQLSNEVFTVTDAGDGHVALYCPAHNRFITMAPNGQVHASPASGKRGIGCKFAVIQPSPGNGVFHIQSIVHKHFICMAADGKLNEDAATNGATCWKANMVAPQMADNLKAEKAEKDRKAHVGKAVALYSEPHTAYLCLTSDQQIKGGPLVLRERPDGGWTDEVFIVKDAFNNNVTLYSPLHNRVVTMGPTGEVYASPQSDVLKAHSQWEHFTPVGISGLGVSFHSGLHNRSLLMDAEGAVGASPAGTDAETTFWTLISVDGATVSTLHDKRRAREAEERQARLSSLKIPVLGEMLGKPVALYSPSAQRFLCMSSEGDVASGFQITLPQPSEMLASEVFVVFDAGNGNVALHSPVSGRFVSMSEKGSTFGSPIAKQLLDKWNSEERFMVVPKHGGYFALRSVPHEQRFLGIGQSDECAWCLVAVDAVVWPGLKALNSDTLSKFAATLTASSPFDKVQRLLTEVDLESLRPKLEALGVRSLQDLPLVEDADLVRWGLTTIERRRFFGHVRKLLGDGSSELLTPPSALTTLPGRDKACTLPSKLFLHSSRPAAQQASARRRCRRQAARDAGLEPGEARRSRQSARQQRCRERGCAGTPSKRSSPPANTETPSKRKPIIGTEPLSEISKQLQF